MYTCAKREDKRLTGDQTSNQTLEGQGSWMLSQTFRLLNMTSRDRYGSFGPPVGIALRSTGYAASLRTEENHRQREAEKEKEEHENYLTSSSALSLQPISQRSKHSPPLLLLRSRSHACSVMWSSVEGVFERRRLAD